MKCSNGFLKSAIRLSEFTRNPHRVYNVMRHTMNSTIKLLKANNVLNLMRGLVHRGLVLTPVMAMTENLCKSMRGGGGRRPKILAERVMRWKLWDAERVVKEQKEFNTRNWRECEKVLKEYQINERYFILWEREKNNRKRELEEKRRNKVENLIKRDREKRTVWQRRRAEVNATDLRGIDVSDRHLDERFESKPRRYGGIELTPEESELLSLPPKFAIFEKPNIIDCEIEIEKGLTKMRWSRMEDCDVTMSMDNDNEQQNTTIDTDISNRVSRNDNHNDENISRIRPRSRYRPTDNNAAIRSTVSVNGGDNNRHRSRTNISDGNSRTTTINDNINNVSVNSDIENIERPIEREWPYDPATNTIDLRHLRSTDLPFNTFVHMPPPLKEDEEIKCLNLKRDLVKVAEKYISEIDSKTKNDGDLDIGYTNLTKLEIQGLKSLSKKKDVVIFQTDKSGRMAIDSKDSYIRATEPHISDDPIIKEDTHIRCQKEINAHATMWVRFLKAGEYTSAITMKGVDRIRNNIKVHNHGYAPLYTLRKDHKKVEDHPTRPVCGGSAAYNNNMSYMLGLILRPVWQEIDTSCLSTEEMLATIKNVNESGVLDEICTVGSADVTALYPSIDVEFAAEKVCEMFMKSEVKIAEVDTKELGLYLALNKTPTQLEQRGLNEYCPTRKTNRGRPPNITGCAQSEQIDKRHQPWNEPINENPNEDVIKRMLAEALNIAICFIMKNHIYKFNGHIRCQSKGGPIGLGLTGDVAQVLMCWWDMKLKERLNQEGMDVLMYKRLVDDVNMVVRKRGVNDDRQMDKENMEYVQSIANEIHHSIQVTIDYPSKNERGKIPILDLNVWMSTNYNEVDHRTTVNIMHEYYYKEVATKAVINSRAAVPEKMKRTVLTQEIIRILRNCSLLHVEEFY